jgi:hypothetical protein
MDEQAGRELIAALVRGLAEPPRRGRLMTVLEPWAGVPADRTSPNGREWLRRWGPARRDVALPVCTCATGRCASCN